MNNENLTVAQLLALLQTEVDAGRGDLTVSFRDADYYGHDIRLVTLVRHGDYAFVELSTDQRS